MVKIPAYLREGVARLEQRTGDRELAHQFKELMYRIILNVCETNREFFSAHRSLKRTHGDEVYDLVGNFRKLQYMNPAVSRLWRAMYGLKAEGMFATVRQAAAFYMVSELDLRDLIQYWNSIGSPDLEQHLSYTDWNQIGEKVTQSKIEATPEMFDRIRIRAVRLASGADFSYLHTYGYTDREDLIMEALHNGLSRYSLQDWLEPEDRLRECFQFMKTSLIKTATHYTSVARARAKKHVDEDGKVTFTNTVKTFSEMVSDDSDVLERIGGAGSEVEAEIQEQNLIEKLMGSDVLNLSEKRVLSAVMETGLDGEIDDLLEGCDAHDWMQWLCEQLDICYDTLVGKVIEITGLEALAEF